MITRLIVEQIKTISLLKTCQYFPKPQEYSNRKIIIELNLSNYATKTDQKKLAYGDRPNLAAK